MSSPSNNPAGPATAAPSTDALSSGTPSCRRAAAPLIALAVATLALVACFALPLYHLMRFAPSSQFYSHLPLIPFISAYFVWIHRHELRWEGQPLRRWAILPLALGCLALAAFGMLSNSGVQLSLPDALSLQISAFLMFVGAAVVFSLPSAFFRPLAFPLGMLLFMIPFPDAVTNALEIFFQHTSAYAAAAMLSISGTDFIRDGLLIRLPGITLEVAPECSGIRSSLVLFITSFIAGKMFLKSNTHRALLAVFVIPLAIIRNGFRIFTIGLLCVHVGPHMIHAPIHHKGGPIFFALSLIPFFVFLWYLRHRERKQARS